MKQEVITIDGNKITVLEIKVKTARKIASNLIEIFKGDFNTETLLDEKYDLIVNIANDFVIMPEGMDIDDLSYDDIKSELFPVFQKVNESFLADMMGLIPVNHLFQPDQIFPSVEDSIKP